MANHVLNKTKEVKPFRSFGNTGLYRNRFTSVGGISIDRNSNIYLTDLGNKRIIIFSYYGDYISSLQHPSIRALHSIAIDDYSVIVTDIALNTILKFNSEGNDPTVTMGTRGILRFPSGLTIDDNGDIYVADCSNNRLAIFDYNLELNREIGRGELQRPRDVKIIWDRVYVSDSNKSYHIHIFTKSGDSLRKLIPLDATGNLYICINGLNGNILLSNADRCEIVLFTSEGEKVSQLMLTWGRPTGCVLALDYTVLICGDYDTSCINLFNI